MLPLQPGVGDIGNTATQPTALVHSRSAPELDCGSWPLLLIPMGEHRPRVSIGLPVITARASRVVASSSAARCSHRLEVNASLRILRPAAERHTAFGISKPPVSLCLSGLLPDCGERLVVQMVAPAAGVLIMAVCFRRACVK